MTLQQVAVTDMGRKLLGSEVAPFLWTGVTIAYFQELERQPSRNEILKIWLRGRARKLAHFFRNTLGIPSEPADVVCFNLCNTSLTTLGVNRTVSKRLSSSVLLATSGIIPLSSVNTSLKKWLNISDFSPGSDVSVPLAVLKAAPLRLDVGYCVVYFVYPFFFYCELCSLCTVLCIVYCVLCIEYCLLPSGILNKYIIIIIVSSGSELHWVMALFG